MAKFDAGAAFISNATGGSLCGGLVGTDGARTGAAVIVAPAGVTRASGEWTASRVEVPLGAYGPAGGVKVMVTAVVVVVETDETSLTAGANAGPSIGADSGVIDPGTYANVGASVPGATELENTVAEKIELVEGSGIISVEAGLGANSALRVCCTHSSVAFR